MQQEDRFGQLSAILAEMTGNDINDIHLDSTLLDDLGITEESDLPRIVKRVNKEFEIHLDQMAVAEEVETVENLLTMITDEAELG
ncbi:MAG: hypothetical protein COY81_01275 [Candidatus Pacebacteria bacterium CG_4_10_14_0_8_um_filter_43_12]|nr:MAG: hypothetical protein COY81_01275 [Candidatus Pacebacteria bacterium CG_4_10_14_0_8_um_filter_43_12]